MMAVSFCHIQGIVAVLNRSTNVKLHHLPRKYCRFCHHGAVNNGINQAFWVQVHIQYTLRRSRSRVLFEENRPIIISRIT